MVQSVQCVWCGRSFDINPETGKPYHLEQAGTKICLDCSDKWEAEEVRFHFDKINGMLDDITRNVVTPNGASLPIRILEWEASNWPWQDHVKAIAVDLFGRRWRAKLTPDKKITLKPIKEKKARTASV